MAMYTSRVVVSRQREWIVPAAQPWGAAYAEIYKALAAAERAYREDHGLPDSALLADDARRVTTSDDEVVIAYTIEKEEQQGASSVPGSRTVELRADPVDGPGRDLPTVRLFLMMLPSPLCLSVQEIASQKVS